MGLRNYLRQFLRDLRSQKLRHVLTLFGIVWGTAAVTLLLAFGEGLQERLIKNIRGLGENIVICWPSRTSQAVGGAAAQPEDHDHGRRHRGAAARGSRVDRRSPASTSPGTSKFKVGHKVLVPGMTGTNPMFAAMRNLIPQTGGRFVDDLDMDERRRVVFLGDELKNDLFGDEEAVGQVRGRSTACRSWSSA